MNRIVKRDLGRWVLIGFLCFLLLLPFFCRPKRAMAAIDVLPGEPVVFEQDPNREEINKLNTRAVSNGQGYLCIWQEQKIGSDKDIFGQMVTREGVPDGDMIDISPISGNQTNPDLDSDGTDYFVVWSDDRDPNETSLDIYGAFVGSDGTIRRQVSIETGPGDERFPKVKWNGLNYIVVWEDWKDRDAGTGKIALYGKMVDPNGLVISQAPEEIAVDYAYNKKGERPGFDLASFEDPNFASWVIMWNGAVQDPSTAGYDILGRLLYEDPNDGGLASSSLYIQIPIPSLNQYYPSVEHLNNDFLVVWENWADETGTNRDIWGVRIDALGNIHGNIINISSAPNKQRFPEIISNGEGYFVIWLDQRDSEEGSPIEHVYGARVSSEGFVLNDDSDLYGGTMISEDPNQTPWFPAVASSRGDDDRYFTFWSAREGSVWSIVGRLYDPPPLPQLEWLGTGDYEEDGVDPNSDEGGSPFTFMVKYFSPEDINEPPEISQVWIDLNDDGKYGTDEQFDMAQEDSGTDYKAGKGYAYTNTGILFDGDGVLAYRFFFADKYNVASGDPTLSHTFQVDLSGNQPTLYWTDEPGFTEDGARPDGAQWGEETSFEFRVTYRDEDDDAPEHMELWIDKNGDGALDPNNELFEMQTSGSDYQGGQTYTKSLTLKLDYIRSMYYKFESDDGKNKSTGAPRTGGYISFNPIGETAACLNIQHQFFPSITSTGGGYQVFWEDYREQEPDANDVLVVKNHIWMELLSETREVRDGTDELGQKKIDTGSQGAFKPSAQFDPNTKKTLVIWEDLRDGDTRTPSKDDENIFKPETIYEGLDIYGIFMDANGTVFTDTNNSNAFGEFLIAGAGSENMRNMLNPAMAMGENGQYLIVWEDESRITRTEKTDISARFVKYPEGVYGEEMSLQIDNWGTPGEEHQLLPRVAWNGQYYLAVWQDVGGANLSSGYYLSRIYGKRIEPDGDTYPTEGYKLFNDAGAIELPRDLSDPNVNQLFPDVASDPNGNFLIVWQDSRALDTSRGYDIYGMRVNINSNAIQYLDLPNWEIPICKADGHQVRPRVFWDPQVGQYLIMWLEVPYEFTAQDMLYHRWNYPYPRTGNIKVVRMDSEGKLLDGSSEYEGTSLVGVSTSQDRPDMCCDPDMGCALIWEDLRNSYSYDLYTTSYQSTLNWTGDPNFVNRGVDPVTGDAGSTFAFKVAYRDRSDTAPDVAQVWIDLDDDGSFGADEKFDMTLEDPNAPVAKGLIYTYSKKIDFSEGSDGAISYHYYFENDKGQAQGVGSGPNYLSLTVTEPPQLDWAGGTGFTSDGVNPDQGDSGDLFTFKVQYTDATNIAPEVKMVWIDLNDDGDYNDFGEQITMTEADTDDEDYTDGKIYIYASTLRYRGDGTIRYRFYFNNGFMEAEGDPTSDHTFQINEPPPRDRWVVYYKENGLGSNVVTALDVDGENVVWAGFYPEQDDPNNTGGVSRFEDESWQTFRTAQGLPSNYVLSLTITPNNNVWVGAYGGVVRYDGTQWESIVDIADPNSFISALVSDDTGQVWASTYPIQDPNTHEISDSKLVRYDSGNKDTYSNKAALGGNYITALAVDTDGMVWAGVIDYSLDANDLVTTDYKGIALFDPETEEKLDEFNSSTGDYPGGDLIRTIYADDTGDIWVGSQDPGQSSSTDYGVPTGMGLVRYSDGQWISYKNGVNNVTLGSNLVSAIDRRGDFVYIGHYPESESLMGGATRYSISAGTWQVFNSATEGLDAIFNGINDLVIDQENLVWFGTSNGLYRLDPNGDPPPNGPVLGPYKGLFDPNEDTGCFINRLSENGRHNHGIPMAFTLTICLMSFFLVLIGILSRKQIIRKRRD